MTHETTPALSPADVQATFCATLVDEWRRGGLRHAVVSPGSRSTPLAVALARVAGADPPALQLHVVLDERSASFAALGIAMATHKPVLVLTTSGTAAAELHAAVVEADLAGVALLICTADRPPELRDIGAPQTIDQNRLFGTVVRWFHDPGPPTAESMPSWRSVAARSLAEANDGPRGPGPVHLNLPFREPLLGVSAALPQGRANEAAWHTISTRRGFGPDDAVAVAELVDRLAGRRGVIVAGAGAGPRTAVHRLAAALNWPVLADPRSGCRVPGHRTVAGADAFLRSSRVAAHLMPDVVLRLGAPWASKVVGVWLAGAADDVLIDPVGAWTDPQRTAGLVVRADPGAVCHAVTVALDAGGHPTDTDGSLRGQASWAHCWQIAEAVAQGALDAGLSVDVSEPAIARVLAAMLPSESCLVVASSMPVRDVEWYASPREGLTVLSNRGANGIDGVISTVVGVAASRPGPTVGLLGDLAALHDIGGLVTARALQVDMTLVVVDNGGGGIFEFLPQAGGLDRTTFERLFGTRQDVDLANIFAGFGVRVRRPETLGEFRSAVLADLAEPGVGVVLVSTDRRTNVADHDRVHASVISAVEAALGLSG